MVPPRSLSPDPPAAAPRGGGTQEIGPRETFSRADHPGASDGGQPPITIRRLFAVLWIETAVHAIAFSRKS